MQAPICEVCLNSNLLCSACQAKLDSGQIKQIDVDISRYLFSLSEKTKSLKDIKIAKILDSDIILIIAGRGDAPKIVGKGGSVVKTLAKQFKKSIRVIEEAPDFKDFIEELVSPNTVSGINTLYKMGEEVYRIRIPVSQKFRLAITPESFSQIISNLYNCKAELVFEEQ